MTFGHKGIINSEVQHRKGIVLMSKIVMTGGGTAGHVTPNIALMPTLQKEGYEISYIGSYDGIEKHLIEEQHIPYYGISSGKLRRYFYVKTGCRFLKRRLCVCSGRFGRKTLPHSRNYP